MENSFDASRLNTQSFAAFMAKALYGPDGYYTNRVRIGMKDADFYTASQSKLFAYTIADYIYSTWVTFGRPSLFQIVEIGAGQGELMHRILERLDSIHPNVPFEYVIVEASPYLATQQQSRIHHEPNHESNGTRVRWGKPQSDVPTVVVANEVLDALPVERLKKTPSGWKQAYVETNQESLALNWAPAEASLSKLADQWLPIPSHYEAELCTFYASFVDEIQTYGRPVRVLFVDYGITMEELRAGVRPHGTIRGYRAHEVIDNVLAHPGMLDITADAHWDYISDLLVKRGFHVYPLVSQGAFLMDQGILNIAQELTQKRPQDGMHISGQLKNLVLPGGMGERFSVLECRSES